MSGSDPERKSLERPIKTPGQLLVEGRVPEIFFREMIGAFELADALEARTFGDISKSKLQAYLELFTRKPAFKEKVERLGVIRDAEAQPALAAFQSVQGALSQAGFNAPSRMECLEGAPVAVGVFILPDCQNAGMLETLCLTAIAEGEEASDQPLLPCIDEYFACLEKRGQRPRNPTKARFAAYALARDVIDPQLGRAAQMHAIPWETRSFAQLRQFLNLVAGR